MQRSMSIENLVKLISGYSIQSATVMFSVCTSLHEKSILKRLEIGE